MVPAQYAPVLKKLAFAITQEGHEFDAKLNRMKARQAAERATLLDSHRAIAHSDRGFAPRALRFSSGDMDHPSALARHHEYVAGKHEQGRNAWNPFGGMLTPSSFEENAKSGLLGTYGRPKSKAPELKEKKAGKKDDLKPDKGDNVEMANDDVKANLKDNKKYLSDLFGKAKETSVEKYFPGKTKKVTSDPFLKVAFHRAFRKAQIVKTASQVGVMFLGFRNELENIQASR